MQFRTDVDFFFWICDVSKSAQKHHNRMMELRGFQWLGEPHEGLKVYDEVVGKGREAVEGANLTTVSVASTKPPSRPARAT